MIAVCCQEGSDWYHSRSALHWAHGSRNGDRPAATIEMDPERVGSGRKENDHHDGDADDQDH
jgi:hypothetical protein